MIPGPHLAVSRVLPLPFARVAGVTGLLGFGYKANLRGFFVGVMCGEFGLEPLPRPLGGGGGDDPAGVDMLRWITSEVLRGW
jgi:hypothetical protein